MKKTYVVDRTTDKTIILVPDEGKGTLELERELYSLEESDVVEITFEGERIVSLVSLPKEKSRRLEKNSATLHSLFKRSKK